MILIDAHVHIYDCFHLPTFFDSAWKNFKAEADRCGVRGDFQAVLLLAETSRDDWFKRLNGYAREERTISEEGNKKWKIQNTDETCSLYLKFSNGAGLFTIAGRQVLTEEGLEVLALITDKRFEDGLSVEKALEIVKKSGVIPVIPWGFGKWMGRRGRILKELLEKEGKPGFFLGDSGIRPAFLPHPSPLKVAQKRGFQILAGSDPLPIPSECRRVGSFGLSLNGALSTTQPAKDLKEMLTGPQRKFRPYGRLERPCRFFRNQLLIRRRSKN